MTPQDIQIELVRINEKLFEIFKSTAWQEILKSDKDDRPLEETLGDLMHYGCTLECEIEEVLLNQDSITAFIAKSANINNQ